MNKHTLFIPFKELSSDALRGVLEEFVTRDGMDYGETEISLETKIKQVVASFNFSLQFCQMKI